MRISLKFTCKYRLKSSPNYVFTVSPKMLVNLKTGRVIKQITKGGSIGYVIDGKFKSLTKLRNDLEVIREDGLPF